mgnify:CR=1 FL=1
MEPNADRLGSLIGEIGLLVFFLFGGERRFL